MMIGPPNLTQASLPQLMTGGKGRVAISYMGSTNAPVETCNTTSCERADYSNVTWNGYITMTASALSEDPVLHSAPVNDPADPLIVGYCGGVRCGQVLDFIDVEIGPEGTPWAPYVDGCLPDACEPRDGEGDAGVVGRLVGGPSLWAPDDPNGRYPDATN